MSKKYSLTLVSLIFSLLLHSNAFSAVTFLCAESQKQIATFTEIESCRECFDAEKLRSAAYDALYPPRVMSECGSLIIVAKISGFISYADPLVLSAIGPYARSLLYVELDSNGGYVEPATSIGDILFKNAATIRTTGNCYSACAIVAAGAAFRVYHHDRQIGIHRLNDQMLPDSAIKSAESLDAHFRRQYESLEKYFGKYGVSRSFVDDMKSVPNTRIRLVPIGKLDDYGMGYENIAFRDLAQARITKKCGSELASAYGSAANHLSQCFGRLSFSSDSCPANTLASLSHNINRTLERCF